jgi:hypothetical protein
MSIITPHLLFLAKNGDEQFWKYKFYAANGKAQHALMGGGFFLILESHVKKCTKRHISNTR